MIGLKFPSFPRVSRGIKRKAISNLNHLQFISKFDLMLKENIKECLNFIRMALSSMKKTELNFLGDHLNDLLLNKPTDFPFD